MFVITADQRSSRTDLDRVPHLLDRFRDTVAVRGFDRTAGDEVEAIFDDPAVVATVAVDLVSSGHWSVGIGVDDVEQPLPEQTRAGRGPAFEAARRAVEAAKGRRVPLQVAGPSAWCQSAQTAACLLVDLLTARSPAGREAVALAAAGLTQAEAAERLGISPQAVSLRLRAARWDLQPDAENLTVRLMTMCEEDR
ncbi:sigma factor-like helix-turn-helix DNA-binding protein [Gordonia sp. FQ]|uniref:helix-turn-helix domain-containing protein n=1 Tax=Gordonia sp. FQ TaxID=3446634 RepID=UPI003F844EB4